MSFAFNPPDGLRNVASFPTDPTSEAAARDQFQTPLDQVRDYINGTLIPSVEATKNYAITRQAIINGGFSVNHRAKSGTVVLTAGQYGHDRWKAGSAGCTYTFSTNANVTTITITAGSLIQVIEGVNLFSGTYTLAWTGTAQGKIGAGAYGISGITGAATGGTNLNIEFNAGTLSKIQLNLGDVALPFQPRSYSEEIFLCQRYTRLIQAPDQEMPFNAMKNGVSTCHFRIDHLNPPMRISPSLAKIGSDPLDMRTVSYDISGSLVGTGSGTLSKIYGDNNSADLQFTLAGGTWASSTVTLELDTVGRTNLLLLDAEI